LLISNRFIKKVVNILIPIRAKIKQKEEASLIKKKIKIKKEKHLVYWQRKKSQQSWRFRRWIKKLVFRHLSSTVELTQWIWNVNCLYLIKNISK
jgi:hypothetical protein